MLDRLQSRPFQLAEKIQNPVDWVKVFLPMIVQAEKDEDFEAAQAVKDAMIEFLNQFIKDPKDKLTKEFTFKLPDFERVRMAGIICFVDGTAKYFYQ